MDWVNDELAKQANVAECVERINESAPTIYEELWEAILAVAKDPVVDTEFKLTTNGSPYHRKVIDWKENTLTIDLVKDQRCIQSTIKGQVKTQLELKMDKNKIIYLAQGETKLGYAQAAKAIMKPFLFPDS